MTETMTTETQVPAWLNLDAFELSEAKIAALRDLNRDLTDVARRVAEVVPAMKTLYVEMQESFPRGLPDDVAEALYHYTGIVDLTELAGIICRLAGDAVETGELCSPFFERACERHGIELGQ